MGIGEILRSERENKGYSLNDVEDATKIRSGYIEALERENFEEIPGEVYRLGFLKIYSKFLGLDPDAIVSQYKSVNGSDRDAGQMIEEQAITSLQDNAPDFNLILNKIVQAGSIFKNRRLLLGAAATVACLLLIVAVIGLARNIPVATQPPRVQEQQGGAPAAAPQQVTLEIKIVGQEDCWTQVKVDGVENYNGTIKRGDTKTFTAQESVWMKLGNAGGVVVYYNGLQLPPLGKEWSVVTREFTKDSGA